MLKLEKSIHLFAKTRGGENCSGLGNEPSVTLFEHEEYILMECILQTPQIQLHEIANHIFNASGSAFSPQTLCRAMYRLGITRKVSRSQEAKIYSLLPVCLVTLDMLSSM